MNPFLSFPSVSSSLLANSRRDFQLRFKHRDQASTRSSTRRFMLADTWYSRRLIPTDEQNAWI